ncbi:MAG TPA: MBL fold metallo-hydrolase [Solirubrobacteraceae bacterium]|nr:MBL fold metallo-hydrolase [Solirubrobacteraceae bacterium]
MSETEQAPPGRVGAAVTWLGHATVLIELDGVRLITDPLLGARVGFLRRAGGAVDAAMVSGIDGVLLSHLHADHAHVSSLRALGHGVAVLAPTGSGRWLAAKGFADVRELGAGQELELGGLRVRATRASHPPGRWRGGGGPPPIGFLVCGSQTAYFAGDTDLFDEMEQLAGRVDVALLPIAGWGRTLGAGHLDPARAAKATAIIAPQVVVPIHWGTLRAPWPLRSPAPTGAPAQLFAQLAGRLAPGTEVRVLRPGERLELSPRLAGGEQRLSA